jgi:hypothetical protein
VRTFRRVPWIIGLASAAGLAIFVVALYWATQQAPPFYAQALALDPAKAHEASDGMLRQTAALTSDLRRSGQWQAVFSAEQVNGWLAYDVRKNHSALFPPDISEPRVAFGANGLQVGFRWQRPAWSTVVNLEADIYLHDVNVVAIRIRKARAGKLPLPLGGLLNEVIESGREIGLQIEHQQLEGDPLLLVSLPTSFDQSGKRLSLELLELREGALYIAGQSGANKPIPPIARAKPLIEELENTQRENWNIQR